MRQRDEEASFNEAGLVKREIVTQPMASRGAAEDWVVPNSVLLCRGTSPTVREGSEAHSKGPP